MSKSATKVIKKTPEAPVTVKKTEVVVEKTKPAASKKDVSKKKKPKGSNLVKNKPDQKAKKAKDVKTTTKSKIHSSSSLASMFTPPPAKKKDNVPTIGATRSTSSFVDPRDLKPAKIPAPSLSTDAPVRPKTATKVAEGKVSMASIQEGLQRVQSYGTGLAPVFKTRP